jgi:hypothetical protein
MLHSRLLSPTKSFNVVGFPRRQMLQLVIGVLLSAVTVPSFGTTCETEQRRAPVKAVCGDVRDPNEAPLTGVAVSLLQEGSTFATMKTSDGRFSFSTVPQGDYLLRVEYPGFLTRERSISVTRDRAIRCKPSIKIQLGPGTCAGWIKIRGFDKGQTR